MQPISDTFASVFVVSAVVIGAAGLALLWFKRNDPKAQSLFPTILVFEIVVSVVHSINLTMSYVEYFGIGSIRCVPTASFVEGFEWLLACITLGKGCLYIANNRFQGKLQFLSNQAIFLLQTIDALALLTAPNKYFKLAKLMKLQAHFTRKTNSSSPESPKSSVASGESFHRRGSSADLLKGHARTRSLSDFVRTVASAPSLSESATNELANDDWKRFLCCAASWFAFGFCTSMLYVLFLPKGHFAMNKDFSTDCWADSIRIQTSILLFFTGAMSLFIGSVLVQTECKEDNFRETRKLFLFLGVIRLVNSINILVWKDSSAYIDVSTVFLHSLILVLTLSVDMANVNVSFTEMFKSSSLRSPSTTTQTITVPSSPSSKGHISYRDVERLWMTSKEGRKRIIESANVLQASESIKFLEETDEITESNITDTKFDSVYKTFINPELAKGQEVNISYKMKMKWKEAVECKASEDLEAKLVNKYQILKETRAHIFLLLWPEVRKSLKEFFPDVAFPTAGSRKGSIGIESKTFANSEKTVTEKAKTESLESGKVSLKSPVKSLGQLTIQIT